MLIHIGAFSAPCLCMHVALKTISSGLNASFKGPLMAQSFLSQSWELK